ncbi:pyrimidine utilization protein A [Belnapia sp. F-4-1]|uniref:pyrimidine utilization protein A n=1 Tax=Belnapia sp. F-4-1 TaxID=1545443 RepID=UPI0005BD1CFD|nr:pyrimidine utilization protein A [Belnapia sp. F-4-1]
MDIGVFIPIGNNGWLISTTSPQYMPSFDLNREVVQRAERYGFDFALSMIKLRGFGGPSEFWDHNLESFTLMAGLAAVTSRIRLYASVAVLTIPPAIVARMAATIDDISRGRFGVNIVSGWQQAEYSQMGLWPGEAHFARRYEYCAEYVQILRELWATGRTDLKGQFFRMEDCRVSPRPKGEVKIVCAGQSPTGIRFAAQHGDYNFCAGAGVNNPMQTAPNIARLVEATAETGRAVGAYVLYMVIAAETDADAEARWEHYRDGVDLEAVAWLTEQAGADTAADETSTARWMAKAKSAVNFNMGLMVGSHAAVARLLDEAAEVPGTSGIMLVFDDFLRGMDEFGTRIQPLMRCRVGRMAAA